MDWKRLDTVEETGFHEGDEIEVKLMEIDPKTGKFKLSHRVLIDKPADYVERPARERRPRPENGERRNGERRDRPARQNRNHNSAPKSEGHQGDDDFKAALDDLLK
jgi:polyribonucleotide nucleotidyltransferase